MKVFFLFLFISFCSVQSFSQTDTALGKRVTVLETTVNNVQTTVNSINQKLITIPVLPPTNSVQNNSALQANASLQKEKANDLSTFQQWYVSMPIVVFLLVFIILIVWLKKDNYKLGDALQGDVPIQIEKENPIISSAVTAVATATAAQGVTGAVAPVTQVVLPTNTPPTITVSQTDSQNNPVLPKSSSRFIALFSGMAGIVISICMVSYYVYFAMRGTAAPSFDKIFDAVLALGIGVVPYAVNKFTQQNK